MDRDGGRREYRHGLRFFAGAAQEIGRDTLAAVAENGADRRAESGRLTESFACGTAAVLAPIGRVKFPDGEFTIGNGESSHQTETLRSTLIDIQRCRASDIHGWVHRVF